MMSRETLYVFLLQRLIHMFKVFCLPRLGNLPTRKDNPSKVNLRASLVIYMTRKDNPYRANLWASRGCCMVYKENPITLKVNLYSLTLWSNQGNLKDPQANRGINLDCCTVLGGKSTLPNLWCNLSNLSFPLVRMLNSQGHIMVLPQLNLVIRYNLAPSHHQAN